jgi:hypothetical protein
MYLAQHIKNGQICFSIRESYPDGGLLKSRDLVELGSRPDKFIIYPGGNAYYFHEDIYEALSKKGVEPDEEGLEKVFWPFCGMKPVGSSKVLPIRETPAKRVNP